MSEPTDPPRYNRFGKRIGPGSLADRLRQNRKARRPLFGGRFPPPEHTPPNEPPAPAPESDETGHNR